MASFKRTRDDSSPESHSGSSSVPALSVQDVKKFLNSSSESESEPDVCGPHINCCGGTVVNDVYAPCAKRLGKPGLQHTRGQVCCSMHKHFKCASCKSVVHSGCVVKTASGSYLIPNEARSFQCCACEVATCVQVPSCCHLCTLKSLSHRNQNLTSRLPLLDLHKQRQNQTLLPKKIHKYLCAKMSNAV